MVPTLGIGRPSAIITSYFFCMSAPQLRMSVAIAGMPGPPGSKPRALRSMVRAFASSARWCADEQYSGNHVMPTIPSFSR